MKMYASALCAIGKEGFCEINVPDFVYAFFACGLRCAA